MARLIDEEVQNILVQKEKDVLAMLRENQDKLEKLADALLEQETLSDAEVDEILGMQGAFPRGAWEREQNAGGEGF